MISKAQRRILREALDSPTLRVPATRARQHETKVALTTGSFPPMVRRDATDELELLWWGAEALGPEALEQWSAKRAALYPEVLTCSGLAEMLATYGDLPVEINLVNDLGDHRYAEYRTNNELHLELSASPDGSRVVSIAAYLRHGDRP